MRKFSSNLIQISHVAHTIDGMTDFKNCNFLIGITFGLSSSIFRFYKKKLIVETEMVTFNFGLLYLIEHIYNHKGLVMLTPMSILLILF